MSGVSRRQLFTGISPSAVLPTRPPWARESNTFSQNCDGCGDCIERCPTQILKKGNKGKPWIDFSAGECEFCMECALICKRDAFNPPQKLDSPVWNLAAVIATECLAYNQVICRSCKEQCEPEVIQFITIAGRTPMPRVNPGCTGCGACVSVCPVKAISIKSAGNTLTTADLNLTEACP